MAQTTKRRLAPPNRENSLLEFLLYHQSIGGCSFLAFIRPSLALSLSQSVTMSYKGSSTYSLNSHQSSDMVSTIPNKSDIK